MDSREKGNRFVRTYTCNCLLVARDNVWLLCNVLCVLHTIRLLWPPSDALVCVSNVSTCSCITIVRVKTNQTNAGIRKRWFWFWLRSVSNLYVQQTAQLISQRGFVSLFFFNIFWTCSNHDTINISHIKYLSTCLHYLQTILITLISGPCQTLAMLNTI